MEEFGDLERFLIEKAGADLARHAKHLLEADSERPLLLTAHAIVEQLLGEMVASRLAHPEVWVDDADFRSRTNLAKAMGLISDTELNICRVLNSARNNAAHGLGPIPEKWRTEIMRLAFGKDASSRGNAPSALNEALQKLIRSVAGPYLYAKVTMARQHIMKEHRDRWHQLMVERLNALPDPITVLLDRDQGEKLAREVDDNLARELVAAEKARNSGTGG